MAVDLPEPEGPMIEQYSPTSMTKFTLFSALTSISPIP